MDSIIRKTVKKANSIIQTTIHRDHLVIEVLSAGKVIFTPTRAHQANRERAELHGWKQRLADGAALSRDPKTGKPASPKDKLAAIQRIAKHYESGAEAWELRAAPKHDDTLELVIPALMRVYGDTAEKAEATVARLMAKREIERDEALQIWAGTDKVAAAIVAIRAERAAADATEDADDLMMELMNDEADEQADAPAVDESDEQAENLPD